MGTRDPPLTGIQDDRDHPHAYGDKRSTDIVPLSDTGSSPRVWGQVMSAMADGSKTGIIPTRMGTSSVAVKYQCVTRDHPHAYGDKTKEIKENSGFAKSTA